LPRGALAAALRPMCGAGDAATVQAATHALRASLVQRHGEFLGAVQHDADECLGALLDTVGWGAALGVLGVREREERRCACGRISASEVTSLRVVLPLPEHPGHERSVQDLLAQHLAPVDVACSCVTCGAAWQRVHRTLAPLASALVLTVKRVTFDAATQAQTKRSDRLQGTGCIQVGWPHPVPFELKAFVRHLGASVRRGHYVTYPCPHSLPAMRVLSLWCGSERPARMNRRSNAPSPPS
jgi:uncharacterized UBP type Zn finger protein